MNSHVKSGNETVEEFFKGLHRLQGVDKHIADIVLDLHCKGALTHRRLANALLELREEGDNEEDKNA